MNIRKLEGSVNMDQDSEDEVIEEGDEVFPGDNLVVAEPFAYAIQNEYRDKVCENCLK